jgi:hypothetical protein
VRPDRSATGPHFVPAPAPAGGIERVRCRGRLRRPGIRDCRRQSLKDPGFRAASCRVPQRSGGGSPARSCRNSIPPASTTGARRVRLTRATSIDPAGSTGRFPSRPAPGVGRWSDPAARPGRVAVAARPNASTRPARPAAGARGVHPPSVIGTRRFRTSPDARTARASVPGRTRRAHATCNVRHPHAPRDPAPPRAGMGTRPYCRSGLQPPAQDL